MKIYSPNIINGILEENFGQNAISSYKQNDAPVVNFALEWKLYNRNSHYLHILFIDYDAIPVCGMPFIHWTVANIDLYKNNKINVNDAINNKTLIQGLNSMPFYDPEKKHKQFYESYIGPMPPDKDHTYTLLCWTTFEPLKISQGFSYNELFKLLTSDVVVEQDRIDFIYRKDKVEINTDDNNTAIHIDKNTTTFQDSNKNKSSNKEKIPFLKNPTLLYNSLFVSLLLSLIWLTMILLIPLEYPAVNQGYLSTIFFKSENIINLTEPGIVTLIFFFLFMFFDIFIILYIVRNKLLMYKNNKKLNISHLTSLSLLGFLNILALLMLYIPAANLDDTVFYNAYTQVFNKLLSHNWLWYVFIVLFSLSLIYSVLNILISNWIYKSNAKFNIKEYFNAKKQMFQNLFNEMKAAANKRRENKLKKKHLLEEEQELLKNLNEIDLSTAQSDDSFEKNVKLNNDIRSRINEIHEETAEINQSNVNIFNKKTNSVKMNKRSNRIKKQEIAVPDKELEEIFKHLEID